MQIKVIFLTTSKIETLRMRYSYSARRADSNGVRIFEIEEMDLENSITKKWFFALCEMAKNSKNTRFFLKKRNAHDGFGHLDRPQLTLIQLNFGIDVERLSVDVVDFQV